MPRATNQKLKPLYLAKILLERTDEANVLTAQELCDALAAYEVPASRRSIYDDIEALRKFGLDVMLRPGKGGGYYIKRRDFELAELKLLVDAVQSSRFVTGKKSRELIDKLAKLTSQSQAKQLNRQVYVSGREDTLNEKALSSIDAIHAAINDGRKISFKYFDYDIRKKRVYRKSSLAYTRTPVAMCWNGDNYYLVTYSTEHENPFANYRIDRMASVEILPYDTDNFDRKKFNISDYIKRTFGMYSGETLAARLAFDQSLVSAVLDHFGSEIRLSDIGGGRFSVSAKVSNSPVFLAWMFQFGSKAEILEPDALRSGMRAMMATAAEIYGV
jgi:predicted DNA-binding transcriptional regulator YafY